MFNATFNINLVISWWSVLLVEETRVSTENPDHARCTRYSIMWWSLSGTCDNRWFSPVTLVSSTNKTDRHDMTDILLKVKRVECPII